MSGTAVSAIDLETVSARAWRAAREASLGGWRLHASLGKSNRINACWPLGDPGRSVAEAIDMVETWYADQGLPSMFKLADYAAWPADLAVRLAARGYQRGAETLVMAGPAAGDPDPAVTLLDHADARFAEVFAAARPGVDDAQERLGALARVPFPRAFASVAADGRAAAIGACAIEAPWVGLFAMRTLPAARRRGLARRVMTSLLAAAARQGARRAWLQVEADNEGAVRLYSGAGFVEAYRYAYWRR